MAIFYTDSGSIDILAVSQLSASAGITGSLLGTSSYATTAQTISGTVTSASYASTASYVITAQTASYVLQAVSASYSTTSSFALSGNGTFSGSFSGSYVGNGSALTGIVASAAPAGPNTSIQFNDAGSTSGSGNFTFNKSTNLVQLTGSTIISNNLSVGTSLTTSPLTIISSASPLITIQSTTANSYSNMRFSGSGRSFTIGVGNASETTFGVANDFFIYDDTTGAMRMVVDTNGYISGSVGLYSALDVEAGRDLKSNFSSGDEGGQILLNKSVTNTTLTTGVTIDVNQDRVRIFETGGTNRGGYFDLSTLAAGAATDFTTPTSASYAITSSFASSSPVQSSTSGVGATPTATQTDTVTHGLGRTPVKIRIYGAAQFTSNASATPTPFSIGTWTSSGNRCIYQAYNTAAITTTQTAATSATFAIRVDTAANSFVTGIIQNVTATSFDIAWTETGTAAARVYMWEAE